MKERQLDNIQLSRKAWKKTSKNEVKKPIVGLDTETEKGKAFIIGAKSATGYDRATLESFDDVLEFIDKNNLYASDNFFYNLGYDTQALIKHLSHEQLDELAETDQCTVGDWRIDIIPEKKLGIKNLIKDKEAVFYDLAQFYDHHKLDTMAKQMLGREGKQDLGDIDITRLSLKRYKEDKDYRGMLSYYLYVDCELCYELAEHLYRTCEPFIIPKYYYSQASPAQQYYLENCDRSMRPLPRKVMQAALYAYNGGRFEVLKRGTFKGASTYDIKSAYPYHNARIPALDKGDWSHDDKYDPYSLISILRITAQGRSHISPLRHEDMKGLLYYPTGKKTYWVMKSEYEVIKEYGYDVEVHEAYHYHDPEPEYPFRFLEEFYHEKERVGKKHPQYMFYKRVINGFYGKTIQVNEKLEETDDEEKVVDVKLKDGKLTRYGARYKAGLLFNPVIAAEITANTRSQLLRAVKDIQEDVIALATDSIITTKRPDVKESGRLGDWEKERHGGDFTSIGSGVYYYASQQSMKFRGFGKGYDPHLIFQDKDVENVVMDVTRNKRLKKVYRSKDKDYERDLNIIRKEEKSLNLNFDKKRHWHDRFRNVGELYEKQIGSDPWTVSA